MPLDRFVLILVTVIGAAALTIWVAGTLLAAGSVSPLLALVALLPIGLCLYILARVIGDRLNNREDDHYDKIEK
jgi:membrane protein implicated in regulation of membrane protease activity